MKKISILFLAILALTLFSFLPFQAKATSYTYTITGSYLDQGQIPTANVKVAIFFSNGTSNAFYLNTTGVSVVTQVFTSNNPATHLSWAEDGQNYTRIYEFLPSQTSDTVYVCIPASFLPYFYYQFSIADFYGMNNPYLETSTVISGTSRVIERKSLASQGNIEFVMQQWNSYDLSFICDEGTYTQPFLAQNTFLNTLTILAGAFPISPYGNELYAYAQRLNGSSIQVLYSDPSNSTTWLYFEIYHQIGTYQITDYTLNTTGYSYNLIWIMGDSLTDYTVLVQAYVYGQEYDYSFTCPASTTGTNPWVGLLDSLGSWPPGLEPSQIIATAIILAFLCIGSYASVDVGCVLAWLATGILVILGWYTIAIPNFVFAGFVTFLVAFAHAKKTEREL
jgi:hypothetical protein